MSDLINLYICAPVRDCSHSLIPNINGFQSLLNQQWTHKIVLIIGENNSTDGTRDILRDLKISSNNFVVDLVFWPCLDSVYNSRVSRIAFCRNQLLQRAKDLAKADQSNVSLYIAADFDLDLTSLMSSGSFRQACRDVADEQVDALFPFSLPFYYDIYALRAPGWCPYDSTSKIEKYSCRRKVKTLELLASLWFLARHQRICPEKTSRFPVQSAFGGMGIYSMKKVCDSSAVYAVYPRPGREASDVDNEICEHVSFNSYFSEKFVDSGLNLLAPMEHLVLRKLSLLAAFCGLFRCLLLDLRGLLCWLKKSIL